MIASRPERERPAPSERWLAPVWRGFLGRCPRCAEGRLFRRFLKVHDTCGACGLEFHHHRADDLPPYLVIFVVAHVVGTGILVTETELDDVPLWFQLAVWPTLAVVLGLVLIQPLKGAVIGLQYRLGMHGFGDGAGASGDGAPARPSQEV